MVPYPLDNFTLVNLWIVLWITNQWIVSHNSIVFLVKKMSEIICSKEKRRRGENFSKADLVFLCELVEKNIAIIRSKQTNVITNAEKAKVWKEIIDSVNARAGGQKKIGRANQEKVEKSLFYGKVGGCSK